MARTWLINGRGIARKVKNAISFSEYRVKELGIESHRECPNCKHVIDNDASLEWPGLPAGVKFDPTGVELLEHLAGKVGMPNSKPHIFIDEFIPTLEEDHGICYTHPENLPGVRKDGSSVHFFHRISNAYATGCRKRRKIYGNFNSTSDERVRWHKTGKNKPVMENGVRKGWKKILVLHRSVKGCKPDKAKWVMHQYHLGIDEEEKDGELVVAKIFYQHNGKQTDRDDTEKGKNGSDVLAVGTAPRTPKTITPEPPRPDKLSPLSESCEYSPHAFIQEELHSEVEMPKSAGQQNDDDVNSLWFAGESQGVEEFDPNAMNSLLCHEVLESFAPADESSMRFDCSDLVHGKNDMLDRNPNTSCPFPELDDIHIDTPLDFQLADLQFGSQDSISSWLDRL